MPAMPGCARRARRRPAGNLLVVSAAFAGLGRVQRSRLVHDALGEEFGSGLHAVSLTLRTPAEQEAVG